MRRRLPSAESAIQRFAVDDASTRAISATQRRTGDIGKWGQTGIIFNHLAEGAQPVCKQPVSDRPPKFVRATLYRYKLAEPSNPTTSGGGANYSEAGLRRSQPTILGCGAS